MSMKTDLEGRIERLGIRPKNVIQTLYEAVSNSIHAIDAADGSDGAVKIEMLRDHSQLGLPLTESTGPAAQADIVSIRITDNGSGFTSQNMEAFRTLDTRAKAHMGGKGVGRLVWLKFFDHVTINSIYTEDQIVKHRSFEFRLPEGVVGGHQSEALESRNPETVITLTDLKPEYAESMKHKLSTIRNYILQHFLSILLTKRPPEIVLIDGESEEKIAEKDFPEHLKDLLTIKGRKFEVIHTRIRSPEARAHAIRYCADGRVVKTERMKSLPNSRLESEDGPFYYQAFVSSDYLNERANQERTVLFLDDDESSLFDDVTLSELRNNVERSAKEFLADTINLLKQERDSRLDKVLDEDLPEYKYVKEVNREELESLPLDATEFDIEETLANLHFQNLKSGRELLGSVVTAVREKAIFDSREFYERFEKEFQFANKINQANLTSYLIFRKIVIDLFSELMIKVKNRFQLEASIHELLFPMGKDMDSEKALLENNLWLIDERLTFARYIASDMAIKDHKVLFEIGHKDEPDIVSYFSLGFSSDPLDEGILRDVVVVELKRPGPLHNQKEDPYKQVVRYIGKIRDGFYNNDGEKIKASDTTRFFCYIVCNLDSKIINELIKLYPFTPIFGGKEGYFLHNDPLRAYVELVPFEKLLRTARRNHRAFFDRAGLAQKIMK